MVTNPFLHLDDKELMLKYQSGNHMAFDVIYSRHKDKVYQYLFKRLHHSDDVDDVFQKVFIKFHKSRQLYQSQYDVLPWLYTITRSEFLDYIKRQKISGKSFSEAFNEELHTSISNDQNPNFGIEDIDSESSLTKNEKEALKQRYYNDQDFQEIAQILQTTTANSRKLISRGLKKLREKFLKNEGGDQ